MESKWHKDDKVWWVNTDYYYVIQVIVYQVISIQVDDGPVKIRYRLRPADERDKPELIDVNHLAVLDEEWEVGDNDLFLTRLEALDELFDRMSRESDKCAKRAAWLMCEIERVKARQHYYELKEEQNNGK